MIIIIDCAALVYRCAFAIDEELSTSEGVRTEIIYGFLKQLLRIKQDINFNGTILFAWEDSTNKDARRRLYSAYKKNRKKSSEIDSSVFEQADLLRKEILPAMGFKNSFMQSEREADDIIASLVFQYEEKHSIVLVSSDKDLLQLLNDDVCLYKVGRKEDKVYTYDDFKKEYGIEHYQWIRVRAIAGCSTDNVQGIQGVGEKTVCKYLRGELNKQLSAYKKIVSKEGIEIEKRNTPLVKLPFKDTKQFDINTKENLKMEKFANVFEEYEFEYFMQSYPWQQWVKSFSLS